MKLGIVIGSVVAGRKTGRLAGRNILVVRFLNAELEETDTTFACVDTVGAGGGDVVLLCASSSARVPERARGVATDLSIVGIVDAISVDGRSAEVIPGLTARRDSGVATPH